MSALAVTVAHARPEPYAAVPTICLRLRVENLDAAPVHTIVLRAQIRIEPQRRRYSSDEQQRLVELFGAPPQWSDSLRPFLWTHVVTTVPAFRDHVEIDLPVTCTYDLEVASTKYLHALADGEVPLVLLFNGTVFGVRDGSMTVQPIAWSVEADYRLPVAVWRATMDAHFPDSGWIRLRRDTIDAISRFKADRVLTSWDDTVALLLKEAER